MEKMTIKIDDTLFKKVKERMEKKGCKTLSQCGRELFELALKIEEAAALQDSSGASHDIPPLLLDILKLNLTWVLETRFLLKYWMVNEENSEASSMAGVLQDAKKKTANDVTDLLRHPEKLASLVKAE
jgi:hypothetical protein